MTIAIGILFIIVCLLLVIIILLQRGRGGGLAGAFGGSGGHSAFGSKTGDVFTWVTVALTGIFLLLSIVANFVFVPQKFQGVPIQQTPPPIKATNNVGTQSPKTPASNNVNTKQPAGPVATTQPTQSK
ncbi:MAG: preprotein translocase subunit SecG [Phycisphaerae bacterium]